MFFAPLGLCTLSIGLPLQHGTCLTVIRVIRGAGQLYIAGGAVLEDERVQTQAYAAPSPRHILQSVRRF